MLNKDIMCMYYKNGLNYHNHWNEKGILEYIWKFLVEEAGALVRAPLSADQIGDNRLICNWLSGGESISKYSEVQL